MTNSKEQKEKALAQVLDLMLNAYKPREQREIAEWFVLCMKPEVVESLANDYDELNEDTK